MNIDVKATAPSGYFWFKNKVKKLSKDTAYAADQSTVM